MCGVERGGPGRPPSVAQPTPPPRPITVVDRDFLLHSVAPGTRVQCVIQRIRSTLRSSTVYRMHLVIIGPRDRDKDWWPAPAPNQPSGSPPPGSIFLMAAKRSYTKLSGGSSCFVYTSEREKAWSERSAFGWVRGIGAQATGPATASVNEFSPVVRGTGSGGQTPLPPHQSHATASRLSDSPTHSPRVSDDEPPSPTTPDHFSAGVKPPSPPGGSPSPSSTSPTSAARASAASTSRSSSGGSGPGPGPGPGAAGTPPTVARGDALAIQVRQEGPDKILRCVAVVPVVAAHRPGRQRTLKRAEEESRELAALFQAATAVPPPPTAMATGLAAVGYGYESAATLSVELGLAIGSVRGDKVRAATA
eukprot:CAMPEP_0182527156 /NCGR_PEP_ID=MMETSP1323-20130603/3671_1 /TAXON_ID=236787 /ORGANISM="Florenciella parvula, Strain RCC1693" /LENGTH=362 /DNA_ID=CAMNT_0024736117 /DNA_START=13 /DNA_END=1097 /DNA_ORIENTATION=+